MRSPVVRWHREGFRRYWRRKSRPEPGRPRVDPELRSLIRKMATANPLWGAPRVHGELLHRILRKYFDYYHRTRTHLSLGKDFPRPRPVQRPSAGEIVELPEVGGLHHRYERRAA